MLVDAIGIRLCTVGHSSRKTLVANVVKYIDGIVDLNVTCHYEEVESLGWVYLFIKSALPNINTYTPNGPGNFNQEAVIQLRGFVDGLRSTFDV